MCKLCVSVWVFERVREKDTATEGVVGVLLPVHTVVWHYESWRPLCVTSDAFWSSQWACGERLDESSAEQRRGAAEALNGSEMRGDSGVNVFIKKAEKRQGRTGERNEDVCQCCNERQESYLRRLYAVCCGLQFETVHRFLKFTSALKCVLHIVASREGLTFPVQKHVCAVWH